MLRWMTLFVAALAAAPAHAAPPASDSDTTAWWALTSELSGDAMEGRDTGSPAYDRAAALVARRFAEAGLKPAGVDGTWFQPIDFDDWRVDKAQSNLSLGGAALAFNREIVLNPEPDTPAEVDSPATFRGLCAPEDMDDIAGKIVVCTGSPPPARLSGVNRAALVRKGGGAGMVMIAAPGLVSEPIRWPRAYSRSVAFLGTRKASGQAFLQGTLNPAAFARVVQGDKDMLTANPPHAELGRMTGRIAVVHRVTRSANVLGLLPGTDPSLAAEVVVVGAHLDGYGHGEPVNGDGLYNGALDDAAYVALLERLASRRAGRGFARPVLFAVFTGEEKGLLGSEWYVAHPTLPIEHTEAMINLDQIRPLYPLKKMTVHGLSDSNLGDPVRQIAAAIGFAVQEDLEPERNLLRRSDNWPFMKAGVPGLSFVLATYDKSSLDHYYDWYQRRYHHPADDLDTPMDWQAAADFNRFFYALTESVANAVVMHPFRNDAMKRQ